MYCIDGYYSFTAIEHHGLVNVMQTRINYGAKYGKLQIAKQQQRQKL